MPSKTWANGSTRQWRKVRAFVLDRDDHTCRLRYPDICLGRATDAHHTAPRETVGDDPAHLVAACAPCNNRAGDPRTVDPAPRGRTQW